MVISPKRTIAALPGMSRPRPPILASPVTTGGMGTLVKLKLRKPFADVKVPAADALNTAKKLAAEKVKP